MDKIKLYHYSNVDFKDKIKISFFGANTYTRHSRNLSIIKRSHFYLDRDKKEYFFNGVKFLYITEINKNKLYNLNTDDLKCNGNFNNVTDFYKFLKDKGYYGIIGNNSYNVAILFKDIKITDKINLLV